MVKVNYTGVSRSFVISEFRGIRDKLTAVQSAYPPFRDEYRAIEAADKAVCAAADLLTGEHECLTPKLSQSKAWPGDDEKTPQTRAAINGGLK